jgi:hypothetical protein
MQFRTKFKKNVMQLHRYEQKIKKITKISNRFDADIHNWPENTIWGVAFFTF